jgi:hypothetical protein
MGAPKGNKFALGLTTSGQPPMFATPEELESKCQDHYAAKKEFLYIVKRAKLTVENSYELSGTTFDMFALKNMGWKDKTEVENTNKNLDLTPLSEEERKAVNDKLDGEY